MKPGAPTRRGLLGLGAALGLATLAGTAAAQPAPSTTPLALVTILDGDAILLRDNARLALAEGVALRADDVLELGPQARFLKLEFIHGPHQGLGLALGPGSRALLSPRLAGERARAPAYLLTGWAKLNAPKGMKLQLLSPQVDLSGSGATALTTVLALRPEGAQVFAEQGELAWRRPHAQAAPASTAALPPLKSGEWATLPAAPGAKPETAARPAPAFVQALPRAFLDSLPPRAARFQDKTVEPKRLGAIGYADAQPWLAAPDTALRRASLPRWRPLARDAEFKRGLQAGLKSHPEWDPILNPPPPPPAAMASKPASPKPATAY